MLNKFLMFLLLTWSSGLFARVADEVWYKGSVAEAFDFAKSNKRLLFLYWGAEWCPPCNDLKAEVFANPNFQVLMKPFVPVYLDGDTDRAQEWGERLKVDGYPTVLILASDGSELFRLTSGLDFAEFEDAIQRILRSVKPLKALIDAALTGKAASQDWWRLAYLSWEQIPKNIELSIEKAQALKRLVYSDALPKGEVNARLTTSYLAYLLSNNSSSIGEYTRLLLRVFQSEQSIEWSRNFVIYQAQPSLLKILAQGGPSLYLPWKKVWLEALESIEKSPHLSVDARLWSVGAQVLIEDISEGKGNNVIKNRLIRKIHWADGRATDPYQRHAFLASAAYFLPLVGESKMAKDLLYSEVVHSKNPWYLYVKLRKILLAEQDMAAAYKLSLKALDTVKGRASRIEMHANHFFFVLTNREHYADHLGLKALRGFYTTVLSLSDGFLGRNNLRVKQVEEFILAAGARREKLREVVHEYKSKCKEMNGKNQLKCFEHFKNLAS